MKNSVYLLFLFAISTAFYGQNKVDKSKDELNSKPALTSQSSQNSKPSEASKSVDADDFSLFFDITFGVFKYGFLGDYDNEDHLYNSLSVYPFYNSSSGNYNGNDTIIQKNKFRLDVEDKFLYSNNDLFGNHLKVKIRPFQYFYLQTDFRQIIEINRIDDYNNQLSLFHFNFCYDRIRMGKFDLGWSLGASYVGNEVKKGGFSYGVSANYFMGKKVSFSGSGKWSKINQRPVNAFEFQAKFHRKNGFLTAGFEHLKIATPTYNFICFGGGLYL